MERVAVRYQDQLDEAELKRYTASINQRAKALGLKEQVTVVELRSCILDSRGRCGWCEVSVVNADFEIDHIISLSKSGANTAENLVVACSACNRRKSEMHPARFALDCVQRTGRRTALIKRVLAHYGEDAAHHQLSLFDLSEDDAQVQNQSRRYDIPHDDDATEQPHYKW